MHERLTVFAQFWGLVSFVGGFIIVLIYALWPGNRTLFHDAAESALNDEEGPYRGSQTAAPEMAADGASEESMR